MKPGTTVPIGTTIAHLEESTSVASSPPGTKPPAIPTPPEPSQAPLAKDAGRATLVKKRRVSPLARRIALDLGIDPNVLPEPPDGGPITRQDVEIFAKSLPAKARSADRTLPSPPATGISEEQSERLRSAIASLMSRSQREIPHYFVESEINVANLMAWLDKLNAGRSVQNRLLPIVPILKAVALAARSVKGINGFFQEGRYQSDDNIRLGVVLSLRSGGIVSPALVGPDKMSMDDIMTALMDLIQRARHGKLKSSEVTGQTLTVTSLGDLGADRVMGMIYPPQVALVGIGRIRSRPSAQGQMLGSVPTVYITLAGDHRASDGLSGASFLGALDLLLQSPDKLL
jgi:pyruvate dehydrogenase E2 component (dihydrolipoamide acetyltransferase)